MKQAIIALGSNIGDAPATIRAATDKIGSLPGVTVTSAASIYRSEPAFLAEQAPFANTVIVVRTTYAPLELLHILQALELDFGRVRSTPNGPRTLDLDLIDYEGVTLNTPELTLPHPGTLERDFVVTPLLEAAPNHTLANGEKVTRTHIKYGKIIETVCHPALDAGSSPTVQQTAEMAVGRFAGRPAPGTLHICATPIGNLGDITLRALAALRASTVIYAEDTRVTAKLLAAYAIKTPVKRCDENTMAATIPQILQLLAADKTVSYVSDAGTPTVSDPGSRLVAAARAAGHRVDVLPGASAVLTALTASGFNAQAFYFGGFLPRKQQQLTGLLERLAPLDAALVFYESPHRIAKSLAIIAACYPSREVVLARELTKLHEEVLRLPARDLAGDVAARDAIKGEMAIVIAPPISAQKVHKDKYAQ